MKAELQAVSERIQAFLNESLKDCPIESRPLDKAVAHYPAHAGKMLRPALLLWTSECYLEDSFIAIPVAAGLELYHTWTLVHDDIIDADDSRRGTDSVHKLIARESDADFGLATAILAGDYQQAMAFQLIQNAEHLSADLRLALLNRLNDYGRQLIDGECRDVEFERRDDVSPEEIEHMLLQKTALLLRFAAEAGVMIGCDIQAHNDPKVKAAGDFAESIGLAFQLRDDLLGMFGDEEKLGKPVGSDYQQKKKTYLFALCEEKLEGEDLARFKKNFGNKELSAETLSDICSLIESCGAREAVEARIDELLKEGLRKLQTLPACPARKRLEAWADFACSRDY